MSQKTLTIRVRDGKSIYCIIDTVQRSRGIVVFVHGLNGHPFEHQFYNAVPYFNRLGYNTCRIWLYGAGKAGRTLIDCTVDIHSKDIEDVLRALKRKHKKIFLVGHSLGGPSVLRAKLQGVSAVVLWEPSHEIYSRLRKELKLVKPGLYTLKEDNSYMLGKNMINDWLHRPMTDTLVKDLHVPLKLIYAGGSPLSKKAKKTYNLANRPKALAIIHGADHIFSKPGNADRLFKETYEWIKKFS